jgi:hypothetical protein
MKLSKYIYGAAFFIGSATVAQAAWLPARTIESMHMTPTGNSIYVTFDASIGYFDCAAAKIISFPSTAARFDEMYAGLLRAQAAQTAIEVRDVYSGSTCNPAATVVQSPYLRFLSQ